MRFAFKKPTHPTPSCFFWFWFCSLSYIGTFYHYFINDPSNFLGSDSTAVLVLYSVVISVSACAQFHAFQASDLSPPSGGFASAVVPDSSPFIGFLVVTLYACCSAFLTICELLPLTGGLRSICQFYQKFNQINLLVDASNTNNSSKRKRKIN